MQVQSNNWGTLHDAACYSEVFKRCESETLRVLCIVSRKFNNIITTVEELRRKRDETLTPRRQIWRILENPKHETLQLIDHCVEQKLAELRPKDTGWKYTLENGVLIYKNEKLEKLWNTGIKTRKVLISGDFATNMVHISGTETSILQIHHLPTQNLFNDPKRENKLIRHGRYAAPPFVTHHEGEYKICFVSGCDAYEMLVVDIDLYSASDEPKEKKQCNRNESQ